MEVEIDPRKSPQENAAIYYEKAKKLKRKIKRLKKEIERTKQLIVEEQKRPVEVEGPVRKQLKEWYESFHWLRTSGGLLAIGGKDARTNQILVKKHMEKGDLFLHADIHGAPVVILKNGQKATDEDKKQAALFAACYSSAWKEGTGAVDVYAVAPSQVKLAARAGEYVPKGAFVIEGKRKWFKKMELRLRLSVIDGKIVIIPAEVTKTKSIVIVPDPRRTKGQAAKSIKAYLNKIFPKERITIDDVLDVLPNGGSAVKH